MQATCHWPDIICRANDVCPGMPLISREPDHGKRAACVTEPPFYSPHPGPTASLRKRPTLHLWRWVATSVHIARVKATRLPRPVRPCSMTATEVRLPQLLVPMQSTTEHTRNSVGRYNLRRRSDQRWTLDRINIHVWKGCAQIWSLNRVNIGMRRSCTQS